MNKKQPKKKSKITLKVSKRDWKITFLLVIASFLLIIVFLLASINSRNNASAYGVQITFIVLIFVASAIFFIFATWLAYLKLYINIWSENGHSLTLLKITFFIIKYLTFGWWIIKKYDYALAIKNVEWEKFSKRK